MGFHFRRQQPVGNFIADFYCHRAALVVEIDGPVHDRQQGYGRFRDRIMEERGLRVLRIKDEDVHADIEEVLRRISEYLRE